MHAALPEGERAFQRTTSLERALPVLLIRVSLSEVVGQGEDSFVEREGVWGQEEIHCKFPDHYHQWSPIM